jgi:hypothetical protein
VKVANSELCTLLPAVGVPDAVSGIQVLVQEPVQTLVVDVSRTLA